MKFKKLFLMLIFLMSCSVMFAQMTDSQIQKYAKQRMSAGADMKTIGAELISKGATKEQLEKIYSNAKSGKTQDAAFDDTDVDRSRVNNGEKFSGQKKPKRRKNYDYDEDEMDEDFDFEDEIYEGKRKVFGHDIFRSKKLSFEPNMSMATSPTYVVGPGDELIVDVYGASQKTTKAKVAPDGTLNIPRIGPIAVAGMTVEQAQNQVRAAMGKHYRNSNIKLSVGQTRTISISVMGEVKTPGTYTLSSFATVFHALYMAGGINDMGTLRDVKVARNGRIISTVDVYEYILNGRLAGDVKLRDNDVIIVGSYANLVQIMGNIKRPMWYEMKKNESLKSLMTFCGGFTGDAYTKNITVNRKAGDQLSVYTVEEFDFASFTLADEDSVVVGSNEARYNNMVAVKGAIKRPGKYELTAVKSVRGLVETAGGLQEFAMVNRAVLVRMTESRTRKTISVDLKGIMDGTVADIPLANEDELQIASFAPIMDKRTMSIEGEVWTPGAYPYSENTTVEDLITMAGGLKESATLLNVEVARRIVKQDVSEDSEINSETFNFKLSEGLKIEGASHFTLQPYDKVFVRRSPVYEEQNCVTVSGEVVFAGKYTLENSQIRISDIIKKAGGLKKNASARSARLIRLMDDEEHVRMRQLQEMAENSADSLKVEDFEDKGEYNVGIELDKALEQPGSTYDIVLRDGDQIIVPKLNTTVKISGEVLYPNSVTYIEGKSLRHYINEAGGYTKNSIKSRAYIVYANGHVSRASSGKIEPGCEIIVPMKEKKEHADDGMKWISLGVSVITAAAVLINAFK